MLWHGTDTLLRGVQCSDSRGCADGHLPGCLLEGGRTVKIENAISGPQKIGNYSLEERIGEGGFGIGSLPGETDKTGNAECGAENYQARNGLA